ncbi:2-hydroxyacid dehydrogenase [Lentibacillus salinarum]|uniref:2-hydroxyacid dehydrogenase n=1 Tax=Lentibacillus salinarum TaxID=446820 RepID=A0ABW3ZSV5_9BACI
MMKPVVYVTRKIPDDVLQPYREVFNIRMWEKEDKPVPRDILLREAAKADGLLCLLTESVDKELLAAAKNLKVVANMAVGYDNIDVEAARSNGVVVTNTPDVLTETTADLTFALLMATARRVVEAADYIREGKWDYWSPYLLAGSDIHGKTIGIAGMGRIGEAVARRAKGFGMSIQYNNRSRKEKAEQELSAVYKNFTAMLQGSDFIVSLVPLTQKTAQMFDEEAFRNMKSSAIFVNVSRGGTVDEQALYDALTNGQIRAAGLDVFDQEPISPEHPLVGLQNVVCLPHIGSASEATRTKMLKLSLDNLKAVLDGEKAITPV